MRHRHFHSLLYTWEAEVTIFTSTVVKILKHKFDKELRKLFGLVKKDYEILYQKFCSDVKRLIRGFAANIKYFLKSC